jgi:hypothetical protein
MTNLSSKLAQDFRHMSTAEFQITLALQANLQSDFSGLIEKFNNALQTTNQIIDRSDKVTDSIVSKIEISHGVSVAAINASINTLDARIGTYDRLLSDNLSVLRSLKDESKSLQITKNDFLVLESNFYKLPFWARIRRAIVGFHE